MSQLLSLKMKLKIPNLCLNRDQRRSLVQSLRNLSPSHNQKPIKMSHQLKRSQVLSPKINLNNQQRSLNQNLKLSQRK